MKKPQDTLCQKPTTEKIIMSSLWLGAIVEVLINTRRSCLKANLFF